MERFEGLDLGVQDGVRIAVAIGVSHGSVADEGGAGAARDVDDEDKVDILGGDRLARDEPGDLGLSAGPGIRHRQADRKLFAVRQRGLGRGGDQVDGAVSENAVAASMPLQKVAAESAA